MRVGLSLYLAGIAGLHAQQPDGGVSRWFSFDQAVIGTRFIGINTGDGGRVRQQQHQELFRGSLNLHASGRVRLTGALGSGPYFSGAWNHTAAGSAPGIARPYWRQMFLTLEPIRGIELQYGGLAVEPHGTGFVGLAGVGYLTGQRLLIRRRDFVLDRLALSYGYLGDFDRPDMTNRFRRLGRANFIDLLMEKNFGRATLSYQSTRFGGRAITSVGALFQLPGQQTVRFEFYRRANFTAASGFHLGTERKLSSRFTLGGGYVSVDRDFGRLNSDSFWDGNRGYLSAAIPLGKGVAFSGLWTHALSNATRPTMTNFVSAGINYDLLTLLKR